MWEEMPAVERLRGGQGAPMGRNDIGRWMDGWMDGWMDRWIDG